MFEIICHYSGDIDVFKTATAFIMKDMAKPLFD